MPDGIAFLRGVLGLGLLTGIAWACSSNRRAVDWRFVGKCLLFQLVLAVLLLKIDLIRKGFEAVSGFVVKLMAFTQEGAGLLLGVLVRDTDSYGDVLAFQVLPSILFFSALTAALYYLRVLPAVVYGFAWVMKRTFKVSGAECLAAAANVFVGQTEAPLVIRPYIDRMTRSELLCLMTGGMATIAGGVFVLYMGDEHERERE